MKRKLVRLSVFRSNKYIYGQIIDDEKGETLVAVSDLSNLGDLSKSDRAREVGKILAEKALKKGIKKVHFDRGKFKYHGRVKALAEGAKEGGLEF
ncbi:50S ribosomal protein L18 [Candidatus Shapirobacteria bacterium CG10_big_fil_rev_8_21_14_0_10_40_9]|uniref:Large ribosomal subunit protein uL18 n=1 Tax=Candidatus Shapirobacteria bacterium CG10_big_fil_rev_8_21_14_0_10_40_9 TaxID=1974888 RepID=A0A2M8L376_9BACT|nr:MAG: 50S ribosomal protein L18 [Candidatus Shapirobacteria bacterium CG10_big_fil_rev_8_21_14_0_10_40_9]